MKYSKQCPKCGSRDIIRLVNDGFPGGSTKGIMTGWTTLSNIWLYRYVCCNCGYTEEWVSHKGIAKLKESPNAKPVNQ